MTWMLYGANGYTGQLLAKLALERGERPVLAGRNAAKIVPLADELGCAHKVVDLLDPTGLRDALAEVDLVAHCAGPFASTSEPMVSACLDAGTHYLDITGEIAVFEAVYARADQAKEKGVVLLPGAGFDVVPTDCLAKMLADAVDDAVELELAFTVGGGISPGTLKTAVDGVGQGAQTRIDGELRSVPLAHRSTVAEFPSGPKQVAAIPWGDLASAYRSTGIPTITTYTVVPGSVDLISRGEQFLRPLLRMPAVRKFGMSLVDQLAHGPSEERQSRGRAEAWGKVRGAGGRTATAAVSLPAAYQFTADSTLRAVGHVLGGKVTPGAHTPATALGAEFLAECDGVEVGEVRVR
jgi:saccharopine dehydrogenase (NAD+, L-lysine-forming)